MQDRDVETRGLARSAGRELARLAAFGLAGLFVLVSLLALAAAYTGSGESAGEGVDAEAGVITLVLSEEPPQLDSTRATDVVSGMVLGHVMEGLLRFDARGDLVPGVAERWEIRETEATFWLRETARWSDGSPVTAQDFVFAWQTALDPANASEYAFILFAIENAEAINRGELPVAALGAEALDDATLRVHLARPVPYFDKLVAFPTYFPVSEEFYRSSNGRYGADADELLYNGPFVLSRWIHGAHVRLERSPTYWDRDRVQIRVVDFPYVTSDPNAQLNLFKSGKIAYASLGEENLEEALVQRWHLHRFMDGTVFYIEFNHREGRPTQSVHLRRALQHVLDPAELVYKVVKLPGYLPGESLFPVWLRGVEGPLRQEQPAPRARIDLEAARRELDLAKRELGVDELPPLVLLCGDNPLSNKQSEYYQETLKRTLGLDIRIDKQIFKQRLAKMTSGEFDMVLAGWGPDFDDPLTFGDLFASWNANNRGRYASAELDRQVEIARTETDPAVRVRAFGEIQRILFEDAVILPSYERGIVYVVDPRVEGLVRRVVGADPDWSYARIVER